MKLSELIEKYGNKEINKQAVIDVLGIKTFDKPEGGDTYWYIDSVSNVHSLIWVDDKDDRFRYSQGNCFATKEEAETYKRVLETESKLKQYAKEHNEGAFDWSDDKDTKYCICLDTKNNECYIARTCVCKSPRTIYFTSERIANAAIEAVGKDAVMEYLKYEW